MTDVRSVNYALVFFGRGLYITLKESFHIIPVLLFFNNIGLQCLKTIY